MKEEEGCGSGYNRQERDGVLPEEEREMGFRLEGGREG